MNLNLLSLPATPRPISREVSAPAAPRHVGKSDTFRREISRQASAAKGTDRDIHKSADDIARDVEDTAENVETTDAAEHAALDVDGESEAAASPSDGVDDVSPRTDDEALGGIEFAQVAAVDDDGFGLAGSSDAVEVAEDNDPAFDDFRTVEPLSRDEWDAALGAMGPVTVEVIQAPNLGRTVVEPGTSTVTFPAVGEVVDAAAPEVPEPIAPIGPIAPVDGPAQPATPLPATLEPTTISNDPFGNVASPFGGGTTGAASGDLQTLASRSGNQNAEPTNVRTEGSPTVLAQGSDPSAADEDAGRLPDVEPPPAARLTRPEAPLPSAPTVRTDNDPVQLPSAAVPRAASATPPTPQAVTPLPVSDAQFVADNADKFVRNIRLATFQSGGEMQIRLDPPQLGTVAVRVRVVAGAAEVAFVTPSGEAAQMLGRSLHQLKTSLEGAGLHIERLQVRQAQPAESSQSATQHDDARQQQRDGQPRQESDRHQNPRQWRRGRSSRDDS